MDFTGHIIEKYLQLNTYYYCVFGLRREYVRQPDIAVEFILSEMFLTK